MMSRMTIKLQRSPSISNVKLMGQPERIWFPVCIFFIELNHLPLAVCMEPGLCSNNLHNASSFWRQDEKKCDCDRPCCVPLCSTRLDTRRVDRAGTRCRSTVPAYGP